MTIGQKIRELRIKNHMTQEKLAECLGISTQAVFKWETGYTWPDMSLFALCAYGNCKIIRLCPSHIDASCGSAVGSKYPASSPSSDRMTDTSGR